MNSRRMPLRDRRSWVHPNVQPSVSASINWNNPIAPYEVVGELLAVSVSAGGLVGQTLRIVSYSSWMFSNLYTSLFASEPRTTWFAGARVSSKTRSL